MKAGDTSTAESRPVTPAKSGKASSTPKPGHPIRSNSRMVGSKSEKEATPLRPTFTLDTLTAAQQKCVKDAFNRFDRNQSGQIDAKEIRQACSTLL